MASAAYKAWKGERLENIRELEYAHRRVEGGKKPGRRWRTRQVNRMLVLALAAEFQGFCRDLHDETVDDIAYRVAMARPDVEMIVASSFRLARRLDRHNAHSESLKHDFDRFGLNFWDEMAVRDQRTPQRREQLDRLNEARNAIAHSQEYKLQRLAANGYPITLRTVRRWEGSMKGLALTMDVAMRDHVVALCGGSRPW